MEFRWAAGMALWTLLSGPVFIELAAIGRSYRKQPSVPAVSRMDMPCSGPAAPQDVVPRGPSPWESPADPQDLGLGESTPAMRTGR